MASCKIINKDNVRYYMSNNKIYMFIYIAILSILAVSAFLCFSQEGRGINGIHVYLLPLLCLFCFLLFKNIRRHLNAVSVMTISIVCAIRYGIYPLTISLENSVGSSYVIISQDSINLMLYEMILLLFVLNIYSNRLLSLDGKKSILVADSKLSNINKFLLLSTIPIVLVFPSLLGIFSFLGIAKSSSPVSGVVAVTFNVGLYIGYIFLLTKCSRNGKGGLLNLIVALIIAVFFIFFIAIGESSVSRWSFLWIGVPTLIILTNTFPHYKKTILSFSFTSLPIAIIAGSFVKFAVSDFSVSSFFSNFVNSDELSEYFGGLNGLTFAMQNVAQDERAQTLYSTLTDLFCSTPLLSSFFDFERYSTQSIYLDILNRKDLICPLLGQSYSHFGFWGAPIFSILMMLMAIEFERITQKTVNVYLKYAGLSLCITFSLFMCLNTIIIMSNAWVLIIFMLVQLYNKR